MSTLVSFIGLPKEKKNNEYEKTNYKFTSEFEFETPFFGFAALQYEHVLGQKNSSRKPTKWIVIGTKTSGWPMIGNLILVAAAGQGEELHEAVLAWQIKAEDELANGAVLQATLDFFLQNFGNKLGVSLYLKIVDDDHDEIFGCLSENIDKDTQVVLDITHAYRSMPVHALIALGALRWIKGITLVEILYGALDKQNINGFTPVVSLKQSAIVLSNTPKLAQLDLIDDFGGIADCFGESIALPLKSAHAIESLLQFDQARIARGQALGQLRNLTNSNTTSFQRAVASKLITSLTETGTPTGSHGLHLRMKQAKDRRDFFRAIVLANESLILKAVELRQLTNIDQTDSEYEKLNKEARQEVWRQTGLQSAPRPTGKTAEWAFKTLSRSRNAVAHAGAALSGDVPNQLTQESELIELLVWADEFYQFMT